MSIFSFSTEAWWLHVCTALGSNPLQVTRWRAVWWAATTNSFTIYFRARSSWHVFPWAAPIIFQPAQVSALKMSQIYVLPCKGCPEAAQMMLTAVRLEFVGEEVHEVIRCVAIVFRFSRLLLPIIPESVCQSFYMFHLLSAILVLQCRFFFSSYNMLLFELLYPRQPVCIRSRLSVLPLEHSWISLRLVTFGIKPRSQRTGLTTYPDNRALLVKQIRRRCLRVLLHRRQTYNYDMFFKHYGFSLVGHIHVNWMFASGLKRCAPQRLCRDWLVTTGNSSNLWERHVSTLGISALGVLDVSAPCAAEDKS